MVRAGLCARGATVISKLRGGLVNPRKLRLNVAVIVRAPASASALLVCRQGSSPIRQAIRSPWVPLASRPSPDNGSTVIGRACGR